MVALGVLVADSGACAPQEVKRIAARKIKGNIFFVIFLS